MCAHCGCQAITVLARFAAEHDAITDAAGRLRGVAAAGDRPATLVAVRALDLLLAPHTASEERSLFGELRADPEFAAHVEALCAEHRLIAATLARIAGGDLGSAAALETLLRRHIEKEEDGLFPAAAVALYGSGWERVEAAT